MLRKVPETNSINTVRTGAVAKHIQSRLCDTHVEVLAQPLLLVDGPASIIRRLLDAIFLLVRYGQSLGEFFVANND